ncbi:flagellar biosynthesis protein FlhB [Brevibacillus humidisoli]|uniref:flagellar biosynthesis protein FlhB n=1 Tax=Brevibacillus humidisoli TaxID=2895522 RepID=UPI001E4DECE4|nr:flagellar biosynthesis protein FlhB [Brevibacillus humidisoli]UFJ42141.1 flagellar biosynthesis protein FlhB [Brevibacillus humidisoli]
MIRLKEEPGQKETHVQPAFLFVVDLQFFAGEKTEKATPQKKKDARKKGQVAKSSEFAPALNISLVFLFLLLGGPWMLDSLLQIIRESLVTYSRWQINEENLSVLTYQVTYEAVKVVGPIMLVSLVVGLGANYLQVGPLFTLEPLKMKLEKIDPIQGAKRILSLRSLVELCKAIFKISIGLYIAYLILWSAKDELIQLSLKSIDAVLGFTAWEVLKLGVFIGLLLVILAVLDYIYQRYEYEKNLRMSKQDIKDEFKRMEGDPLIKSKIKERQRQMAMRRMMQEIPNADVIITNPIHFAVAIRYDADTMSAPTVIAKGQDYLALKIKEIAKKHRIITMENKPLARALYSQVDVGQQIPEELFKAVAEILAYVYKLQGKVK